MKIRYPFNNNNFEVYNQEGKNELSKLNFLLTNNNGDFLELGVSNPVSKFFGLNIFNEEKNQHFKFLDQIIPQGLEVEEVEFLGYKVKRRFKSKFSENVDVVVEDTIKSDSFGDEGELKYDDNGILKEQFDGTEVEKFPKDSFYLGPSGGMIYEISNFDGNVLFDLDMKELNDFDEWGRDYKVEFENGVVLVEFVKKKDEKEEYKQYFGLKAVNFSYDLIKKFVEKNYVYSEQREYNGKRFIYRLLTANVLDYKRFIIGAGFSKEEVFNQINLLELHQSELEKLDENFDSSFFKDNNFEKPIQESSLLAYNLSKRNMYKFLKSSGCYAGFPWFNKVWTRDDLISLRAFINFGDFSYVKKRLFFYLENINENGEIPRIFENGSFNSYDSLFVLAKRVEDFIFELEKKNQLNKYLSLGEINYIYERFSFAFEKVIENQWDEENELLKPKDGDSWMDTIHVEFPLDIQVQFLNFVSSIGIIASIINVEKEQVKKYLEFEDNLRRKITSSYFRNGYLFSEVNYDRLDSNVFLAYYFYPDLFLKNDWEQIFDNSLKQLKCSWGGISSLSKNDSKFHSEYSGENNESYHCGDSWFWINNISAISMLDLNEKKYRKEISGILTSSVKDILELGCIGFSSEVSSSLEQRAEGTFAQAWSSSTFIELVEKMFK